MATPRYQVSYDERFGVTRSHFAVFQKVANNRRVILLVRGGKPAAIPWIDRGYPGKPIFLKAKVDPSLGLLKLGQGESRAAAYHHLCYVLEAKPGASRCVATCPEHPIRKSIEIDFKRPPWTLLAARRSELDGLVLEEKSLLPYTSDYDLGAVVPVGGSFSAATYADAPRSWQFDYQKNLSNALVDSIAAELNRLMTDPDQNRRTAPRVMHGANAQYSGSPASRDNELLLVFCPNWRVETFTAPTVIEAGRVMRQIWEESSGG